MGWWRIKSVETGQVDFAAKTEAPTPFVNAIPGKDEPENLYNGDGPADAMDRTLQEIDNLFVEAWGRDATEDELRACFNFCLNGLLRRRAKEGAKT